MISRRSAGILLAAAASAWLAASAGAEAATRPVKAIWGSPTLVDGTSAFPAYRDLGVDVVQVQLVWSEVAETRPAAPRDPGDPAYRWPAIVDRMVAGARRSGIQVALMVRTSPPWANGGRSSEWVPDPARYADFLVAASRRYPSVRRWMIWGEANRAGVFRPLPADRPTGPRAYARLLDAAYAALKRRSRRNVVVGGMTFSFGEVMPARWLRWMRLPDGRRPRLDEYGHNPYTQSPPNLRIGAYRAYPHARDINELETFAAEIRRAYRTRPGSGRKGPRLWLSEFSVSSDRPNRAFAFSVTRAQQARWLRAGYRIARTVGASGFGWFNLQDEAPTVTRGLTTGLLTGRGVRKPAYRAYKRLP